MFIGSVFWLVVMAFCVALNLFGAGASLAAGNYGWLTIDLAVVVLCVFVASRHIRVLVETKSEEENGGN